MKCCICNKGPAEGISIFRINAKGVPGIWACKSHIKNTDAPPIAPEVDEIVSILEQKDNND